MAKNVQWYGWVQDAPDARDLLFTASPVVVSQPLPTSVDLRPGCPPVYNQGNVGSCTANCIAAAFQFAQMKQRLAHFMPSRLFIYYNERVMEHCVKKDEGAQIRDGIKSVAKLGVPPESTWPYRQKHSIVVKEPKGLAYIDAYQHKVLAYHRIRAQKPDTFLRLMKSCLAEGYPFVFGFTVYSAFEGDEIEKTGIMNMPDKKKEKVVGGHAVMAVGYNEKRQAMLVRNSWGLRWGLRGYFWMPYAYISSHQLCDDFWTIRGVTGKPAGKTAARPKAKATGA